MPVHDRCISLLVPYSLSCSEALSFSVQEISFLLRLLRVFWRHLLLSFFFFPPFPHPSVMFARYWETVKGPILKSKSAQVQWIWEVRREPGNYCSLFSCHDTKWKTFSISVLRSCPQTSSLCWQVVACPLEALPFYFLYFWDDLVISSIQQYVIAL